jgi:hypothetical protein
MRKTIVAIAALALLCGVANAQNFDAQSMRQPPLSQMFLTPQNMSGGPLSAAETGLGAGQLAHYNSFGFATFTMADADYITHVMPVPYGIDRNYNIAFRVFFMSGSSGSDAPVWKVFFEEKGAGTALEVGSGLADAHTQTGSTSPTIHATYHTAWDTLSTTALSTYNEQAMMQVTVELDDDGGGSADEYSFIGLQIVWLDRNWRFRGATYNLSGGTVESQDKGGQLKRKAGN